MAKTKKYSDKLQHPKWQRKRLEIMQRDNFQCQYCFSKSKSLTVHHKYYTKGKDVWDYPDESLVTLCHDHHRMFHEDFEKRMFTQSDQSYLMGRIWGINYTDLYLFYGWVDLIIYCNGQSGFTDVMNRVNFLIKQFNIHLETDE